MNLEKFKKLYSDIDAEITKEEALLLFNLSKSPKCMHSPEHTIEFEDSWKCNKCGSIAKKKCVVII